MIKSICATLLLCSLSSYNFDFKYSNKDEFVKGITDCTVHFNTAIPPQFRAIVVISVAQATLESSWGESRFARLGNNFYGMIETDNTVIADIWVSKEENCFPMIQSGSAHNEMLLNKDQTQDKQAAEKGKVLV